MEWIRCMLTCQAPLQCKHTRAKTRETKTTKNNINFVIVQCPCFQLSSTNFSIQCMFAWDENENENCSHRITIIIIIDIVSFSRIFHSCFIQKVSISNSHEVERSFLPTNYSDELKSSFSQTHLKSVPLVQRNFTPSLPSLPSLQTWYPWIGVGGKIVK